MRHVGGERMMYTGFGWNIVKERDHVEDVGVDVRIL